MHISISIQQHIKILKSYKIKLKKLISKLNKVDNYWYKVMKQGDELWRKALIEGLDGDLFRVDNVDSYINEDINWVHKVLKYVDEELKDLIAEVKYESEN